MDVTQRKTDESEGENGSVSMRGSTTLATLGKQGGDFIFVPLFTAGDSCGCHNGWITQAAAPFPARFNEAESHRRCRGIYGSLVDVPGRSGRRSSSGRHPV